MKRKKKKYPCVSKKKNKAKVEVMKRNRLIRSTTSCDRQPMSNISNTCPSVNDIMPCDHKHNPQSFFQSIFMPIGDSMETKDQGAANKPRNENSIEPNDGLPQSICKECTDLVNLAINLRSVSNLSYKKLTETQIHLKQEENQASYSMKNDLIEDLFSGDTNNIELPEFEVEIECDRLTDQNESLSTSIDKETDATQHEIKKELDHNKMTRKEKRAMYLELVDGVLDPKGPVKCKVCKKTVSKWSCFISHAKLHLGFNFVCEFCGKSFISSTQLKRHCRSYHGMERELACKHCSYLALDNAQLLLHERRVHTGERPYVCDVCAASYFSRKCLVQHIESHRTTATVQCADCGQSFKSSRHLSRHRYASHGVTRVPCPVCGRQYRRRYLASHVATHANTGVAQNQV